MELAATLKETAKKLLIGDIAFREFITVGIDDCIREKAYLRVGGMTLDVSARQWLLGLDPRIVGIWLDNATEQDLLKKASICRLCFLDSAVEERSCEQRALAIVDLEPFHCIEHENGHLFLLKAVASDIRHINSVKARLLYWKLFKKPEMPYEKLKAIVAAYTYPRRVRIIAFKLAGEADYIFPMDLLADVRGAGVFLLGMRHSNRVLTRISQDRRIVVSEVPAAHKTTIQQLGRNHSAAPPPRDQLPFATVASKEFGFYLPDWAESYKEISIRHTLDLGSHMLLFGEFREDVFRRPPTPRLHHVHFFHHLYLKGKQSDYPVV
jgi:hypothetical protein